MKLLQSLCAGIALISLANPALAAGCASPMEASALKTSVMLQQMMVAAFQCRESTAYNRFISTYRSELQSSDVALKAFFVRRGGEAGYDTFKTKAANVSGLEQARDSRGFCADTHALLAAATQHRGSLASFVEARFAGMDIGGICQESRPVLARAGKLIPTLRVAQAEPKSGGATIGGVPGYAPPANPYRRAPIASPPWGDDYMEDDDASSATRAAEPYDLPPPRPRAYQIRERGYGDDFYDDRAYAGRSYGPPAYGPPRDWRDYPPPRSRYGYYGND